MGFVLDYLAIYIFARDKNKKKIEKTKIRKQKSTLTFLHNLN